MGWVGRGGGETCARVSRVLVFGLRRSIRRGGRAEMVVGEAGDDSTKEIIWGKTTGVVKIMDVPLDVFDSF